MSNDHESNKERSKNLANEPSGLPDLRDYLKKQFPTSPDFHQSFWESLQGEYWRIVSELETRFDELIEDTHFDKLHPLSKPEDRILIHADAKIHPSAVIEGPCIIGPGADVRPGAWIREFVRIGSHSIIGHACEFKNCWLGDWVETSHYNYVGDSVLGNGAHFGAGALTSNFRLDQKPISLRTEGLPISPSQVPSFPKFGGILGEYCEIGSQVVLNPGILVGRKAMIYPLVSLRKSLDEGEVAEK